MDEREANLFLNLMVYGIGHGISRIMKDGTKLVAREAGMAWLSDKGRPLLEGMGIPVIDDADVKTVAEKLRDAFKEKGLIHILDIQEFSEDHMKIKIGDCILAHSCKLLEEQGVEVPPCPILGLMIAYIRKNTGWETTLEKVEKVPEENSRIFDISLMKM